MAKNPETTTTSSVALDAENLILALGVLLARSASDWAEAQHLLSSATDAKRGVNGTTVRSIRMADHGIDGASADGKKKLAAFKSAALALNASDALAIDRAALERVRLALKNGAKLTIA